MTSSNGSALISLVAAVALTAGMAAQACAQQPTQAEVAGGNPSQGDPPALVGTIARIEGAVSFHGPSDDQWVPAATNNPLAAGDAVWTEPQARAVLDLPAARLTLAGSSEFDIEGLDARAMTTSLPQGETFVVVHQLAPGQVLLLRSPRGTVSLRQPGRYALTAGDTAAPTRIAVFNGAADVSGEGFDLSLQAGQAATVTGDATFIIHVGVAERDPFVTALLDVPQPPPPPAALPPAVAGMPGASELTAYGTWQPTAQYGTVWYPRVEPGWAPYRDGHWSYVAPWGWTWVDNATWGFAPSHYGRWVQTGGRWGWAPVYAAHGEPYHSGIPVYAPAVVSFFGLGGAGVSIGVGGAPGASIGWVPLGWGEAYRPWYHTSPDYVREVNRSYVPGGTNLTADFRAENRTINAFANHAAITVVPAAAMAQSRPVNQIIQQVAPAQLAAWHPAGVPPVRPNVATAGVTPALARQLKLSPASTGVPGHSAKAPGPAIGQTDSRGRLPPLRTASRPAAGLPTRSQSAVPAAKQPGPSTGRPPVAAVGSAHAPGQLEPRGESLPHHSVPASPQPTPVPKAGPSPQVQVVPPSARPGASARATQTMTAPGKHAGQPPQPQVPLPAAEKAPARPVAPPLMQHPPTTTATHATSTAPAHLAPPAAAAPARPVVPAQVQHPAPTVPAHEAPAPTRSGAPPSYPHAAPAEKVHAAPPPHGATVPTIHKASPDAPRQEEHTQQQ